MTFRLNFIRAVLMGVASAMCTACIPVPAPGRLVFVPVSDIAIGKIESTRNNRKDALREAVSQAIKQDSVEAYATSWKTCGTACNEDEFFTNGSLSAPWIKTAIREHAWHVLSYQLSQAPSELKQRLLHIAGTRDNGGSRELVTALLDSGARPDGIALANAVKYCRTDMVELLLDREVAPQGRYTGDEDNDQVNDAGIEPFSLLSLAGVVHCGPDIREKLLAHGADPNDLDPVLREMQAAITTDNPAAYELAWRTCADTTYCLSPGWNPAPLGSASWRPAPEAAWVDDAIMARAWRVVAVQLRDVSPGDRDMLLSAAPAYYPERPELIALLRASGAKSNGGKWTPRLRRGPPELE
jgi:hypothetical protein